MVNIKCRCEALCTCRSSLLVQEDCFVGKSKALLATTCQIDEGKCKGMDNVN